MGSCITNQAEPIPLKPVLHDTNPSDEQTNPSHLNKNSDFSKDNPHSHQQGSQLVKQILLNLSKDNNLDEQKLQMIQKIFKGSLKMIHQYSKSLSLAENILNKDSLEFIKKNIDSNYFSNQEAHYLIHFLQKLSNTNQMVEKSQLAEITEINEVTKKVEQLGIEYHRKVNTIFFKHYKAIRILQKLFSQSSSGDQCVNLNKLKYDLRDQQQILKVSKIVKLCCEQDLDAFFFLSAYLKECCMRMGEKQQSKVIQIEKRLLDVLEYLRKEHPPNDKIPNVNVDLKIEQKKKLSHSLKINLKVVEPNKRIQKLESFILQVAEIAERNLKYLKQITTSACEKNNGIQFKTGLKVKNKNNQSSIERVKEKLLYKKFEGKKYNIPQEINNLQQVLSNQNEHYNKNMAEILNQLTQDIEFTVSDMLRGKCMFENLVDIKNAAEEIAKNSNQRGYPFQVDNRLTKSTTDLVFKIKIGETIAEFQLAYKFNVVKNQFNHKIYELARSKFYSALNTLFIFDEKSIAYISEVLCRTKKLDQKQIEVRVRINKRQIVQQIDDLRNQLDKFCIEKRYKLSNQDKRNEQIKDSLIQTIQVLLNNKQIAMLANKKKKEEIVLYLNGIFIENIAFKAMAIKSFQESQKVLENYQNLTKSQRELQCTISEKIAKNWKDIGYLKEALEEFQKCLKLQQNIKKEECIDIANTLNNIGNVHFNQGNNQEALKYFEKCLKIKINVQGEQSIDVAQTQNCIGLVYLKKRNNQEALKYFEKCLKIRINIKGKENIDVAQTYEKIGLVYLKKGNSQEALKYLEKCLKIKITLKGEDNIYVAQTYKNIGNVYKNQRKNTEALKYLEKCLNIQANEIGSDSIQVALTLSDIGSVYDDQGDYQKAKKYYMYYLKSQKDTIDGASIFHKIGNMYKKQGNLQEAFKYYETYVITIVRLMGANSLEAASAISNYGSVFEDLGCYQAALKEYQKCLVIQKNIKEDSIEIAQTYKKIGNVYKEQKYYEQAQNYFEMCLKIQKDISKEDNIDVAQTYNKIGSVYDDLGMYPQALQKFQQVYKICLSVLGSNDPKIKEALQKIEITRSKEKN